jgi:hypothetical protein
MMQQKIRRAYPDPQSTVSFNHLPFPDFRCLFSACLVLGGRKLADCAHDKTVSNQLLETTEGQLCHPKRPVYGTGTQTRPGKEQSTRVP